MRHILDRFRGRADSEHEQAFVRLVIVSLVAVYLGVLEVAGAGASGDRVVTVVSIAVYVTVSLGFIAWIAADPDPNPARRLLGMVADIAITSFAMYWWGSATAMIYLVYLWVTFGNGFRYGNRYLALSAMGSLLGFGAVVWLSPYWHDNMTTSAGLLAALVVLPAYVSTLIRKLTEAKLQAEAASNAKGQFLATMSHELRTPLNAIIGIGGLMQKTSLSAEQRDMTRTIGTSARTLLANIDQILDFSRIEAGRMPVDEVDFDLNGELVELYRMLEPQCTERGLRLQFVIDGRIDPWMRGAPHYIRQILTNLVANAIKFTEKGYVRVCCRLVTRDNAPPRMTFDVIDTGIGIDANAQRHIFEPFTQEDQATSRRYGGAGLGLAICRQLTDLMGGRIGVDSEVGAGSRFWMELPIRPASVSAHTEAPVRPEGLRLRVSDDRLRGRVAALAGDLGLELVAESGGSPDKVVLSIRDQDAGQGTAIDSIETPFRGALVVPATWTATALPTLRTGVYCAVTEPVDGDLIQAAARLGARCAPGDALADDIDQRTADTKAQRPLRVLVAEDNAVNRRVTAMILRQAGHEVRLVENGEAALDALAEFDAEILVLDVNMPGTSGIDVAKEVRMGEVGPQPRLPIIALTADATTVTERACKAAGMDAFVTKPVEAEHLIRVLDHCANGTAPGTAPGTALGTGGALAATPVPATPARPAPASSPRLDPVETFADRLSSGAVDDTQVADLSSHPRFRMTARPVVDEHSLQSLSALDNGGSFVRELVTEYVEDAGQLLDDLERAVAERDIGGVRDTSHALKSSSAHVGAARIQAICSELSQQRRTQVVAFMADALPSLRTQLSLYDQTLRERWARQGGSDSKT